MEKENENKNKGLSSIAPTVNTVKVLSCASNFCKGFLYLFNLIFGISGFVVIGISGWVLRHELSMDIAIIVDSQLYRLAAVIHVVAGCTIVIISVIGSCGIRQENRCFLLGYIVTLIVVICMVFVAGVFSVAIYTKMISREIKVGETPTKEKKLQTLHEKAENTIEFQLLNTLKRQYGPGGNENAQDPMTAAWNNIQDTYDCCGVKTNTSGARLYKLSNWYKDQPIVRRTKVPVTCCAEGSDGGDIIDRSSCQSNFRGYEDVYKTGCYDAVLRQMSEFSVLISGCTVGVTSIQLLGLAFAIFVMRRM